jgi:hypothetical protein
MRSSPSSPRASGQYVGFYTPTDATVTFWIPPSQSIPVNLSIYSEPGDPEETIRFEAVSTGGAILCGDPIFVVSHAQSIGTND